MNRKWYKSNLTKIILVLLAHIMMVVLIAGFMWVLAYPALRQEIFAGSPAKEYKDTVNFSAQMQEYSRNVATGISTKNLLETDGKYNPDKIINIVDYTGNESDGQTTLSYRLGDLIDWYKKICENEPEREQIVVCKKADGTYYYYKLSEFQEQIRSGELSFVQTNEEQGITSNKILGELEYGGSSADTFRGIQDAEGKILYSDCWMYDGVKLDESYAPVEAESIIALANETAEWNGRLSEAYETLDSAIYMIGHKYENYEYVNTNIEEGDTNFFYIYVDTKNGRIYTNKKEYSSYENLEKSLNDITSLGKYVIVAPKLADFESNMMVDASLWRDEIIYSGPGKEDFLFAAAVDTNYPIQDSFYTENALYEKYGGSVRQIGMFCLLAAVLFLVCIVWLAVVAGRNGKDDGLHLNWFDRWKTELAAAIVIAVWVGVCVVINSIRLGVNYEGERVGSYFTSSLTYVENSIPVIICGCVVGAFTCAMFLTGFLSLVRRIKAGTVWKNSILRMLCKFVKLVFDNLNSVWRTLLLFGGYMFIQLLFVISCANRSYGVSSFVLLLMLLADIAAFIWLIYVAIGKKRIKEGIEKVAGGEVDYKIPVEGLRGTQRQIAEEINAIGEGLEAALEKSMRSERLKTDLITNVSHDIKTPLTSIINYVELLKQENFEDPKIRRYIEILEQKSQRLKTLTEDVVEASKVSSGNITLEYMNINLVEMIQQTSGEFQEKFEKRGLKEVLNLSESEAFIYVDGRRTWRILENVYNNAAKYAMEGTRIYADLTADEQKVIFSLKNVSEQPLNISADELTERFIRGDISRSTEGSGLGLSIAKTLTEMQGGKFELYLDGDLFKVTITFPRVK